MEDIEKFEKSPKCLSSLTRHIYDPEVFQYLSKNIDYDTIKNVKTKLNSMKPHKRKKHSKTSLSTINSPLQDKDKLEVPHEKVKKALISPRASMAVNSCNNPPANANVVPFCKYCAHCNANKEMNTNRIRLSKLKSALEYSAENTQAFINKLLMNKGIQKCKTMLLNEKSNEVKMQALIDLINEFLNGNISEEVIFGNKKNAEKSIPVNSNDFFSYVKEHLSELEDKSASFFYNINECTSICLIRKRF